MIWFVIVATISTPSWAEQCRKTGENYTAENMNLPTCASESGSVWGSESSFNSSNGGSMGSTWGSGSSTGSASHGGSASPGARGEHTSTGSGWKAGGTGSGSGWQPGTTGSGNSREPASVMPTQDSQVQQQQQAAPTPAGDVNSTINNGGGDARWIK